MSATIIFSAAILTCCTDNSSDDHSNNNQWGVEMLTFKVNNSNDVVLKKWKVASSTS